MMKIRKTNRLKIPFLYVLGKQFKTFNFKYNVRMIRFNKLVKKYYYDHILLKDGWRMNYESAEIMAREYPEWKYYLPTFSLKDKVILDIGAGCGETARYFLLNGAKRVICVDNNEDCIKYLNINSYEGNIYVIPHEFDYKMLLDIDYDYCKMDIEGYEALLINAYEQAYFNWNELKPTVIEAHSIYCIKKLKDMGFHEIYTYRNDLKLMANYW